MADTTKWDIDNENFSYFFERESDRMTESQRLSLPKELYFKLFNRGGKVDTTSSSKLSFLAKLFILIKALRKRTFILIEDENGMDIEKFFEYREALKKYKYDVTSAEGLITDTVFVLCNKEVMDTYSHLNKLSVSPAYNYLIKTKNAGPRNKTAEYISQINYIVKVFSFYESNRKRITMQMGIEFSEWLVLIYLFQGGQMLGSAIYKSWFRYSYNSSSTKIKKAFGTLQHRGFIVKIGESRGAKLEITALGRERVCEILTKFALNP
jgi:hypothetical protein